MSELIRFPHAGDAWIDIGEGGMYVIAVVPKPVEYKDNCTVENGIVLTLPDYPVSDVHEYWPSMDSAVQEEYARNEAARLMDREGFAVKADLVRSLVSLDSFSIEMLTAVHMGSTSRSLQAADGSKEYWQATWGDLTPTGTLLLESLRTAFGIKPTLLTFLDT